MRRVGPKLLRVLALPLVVAGCHRAPSIPLDHLAGFYYPSQTPSSLPTPAVLALSVDDGRLRGELLLGATQSGAPLERLPLLSITYVTGELRFTARRGSSMYRFDGTILCDPRHGCDRANPVATGRLLETRGKRGVTDQRVTFMFDPGH